MKRFILIILLFFSLMMGFASGTIFTIAADELGFWDKLHDAAETADE